MRGLFVGFTAGVAVGAGGCYLYLSAVKPPARRGVRGQEGVLEHAALTHGVPETDVIRLYDGYVAAYDYRTRNPKWVIEHLTPESWTGEANRERSEFFPDPGVEPRFSAKLSDFRGSGYDRGHMAPAANHKGSQQAMDQTFSLVNISPQVGKGFNRDYWARFERFVKELTDVAGSVYVVTGPLWLPTQQQQQQQQQPGVAASGAAGSSSGGNWAAGSGGGRWTLTHEWIGRPPGLVAVPTHYYKVILADPRGPEGPEGPGAQGGGGAKGGGGGGGGGRGGKSALPRGAVGVGAFVLPNQPIDSRLPLSAFVVPLEDLEQVAGTRFFPNLLADSRRREVLDAAASGWRAAGMAQLKPFERVTLREAFAALPPPAATDVPASPAAASSSASASAGGSAPSASGAAPPPLPPRTAPGNGVVHICEVNACRLPPADFYLRGSGGGGGGGGGNGGGGGKSGAGGAQAAAPRRR